jgi:PD-(D/E)XK nuclease superfamily
LARYRAFPAGNAIRAGYYCIERRCIGRDNAASSLRAASPLRLLRQSCRDTGRIIRMSPQLAHYEDLTYRIIGLAMRVHRHLGPGLLESVYQRCLSYEFCQAGIPFGQRVHLPIRYDDIEINSGYLADFVVADEVTLELKAVEQ